LQNYVYCSPRWGPFLRELSKPSPICALLPFPLVPLIEQIVEGKDICSDAQVWDQLVSYSPVLSESLKGLEKLPHEAVRFFRLLCHLVRESFRDPEQIRPPPPPLSASPLEYFPSLPLQSSRGKFPMDGFKVGFVSSLFQRKEGKERKIKINE